MKNKVLNGIFIAVMAISVTQVISASSENLENVYNVSNDTQTIVNQEYYSDFEFDFDTGTLIKYNGTETNVEIPTYFTSNDGTNVTVEYIGAEAFAGNSSIQSVTIPATVLEIGEKAFYNCTKLSSVSNLISVELIGESAFENCSSLSTLTIWTNIKYIENNAFLSSGLTSIFINTYKGLSTLDNVTEWGAYKANISWAALPVYLDYDNLVNMDTAQILSSILDAFAPNAVSQAVEDEIYHAINEGVLQDIQMLNVGSLYTINIASYFDERVSQNFEINITAVKYQLQPLPDTELPEDEDAQEDPNQSEEEQEDQNEPGTDENYKVDVTISTCFNDSETFTINSDSKISIIDMYGNISYVDFSRIQEIFLDEMSVDGFSHVGYDIGMDDSLNITIKPIYEHEETDEYIFVTVYENGSIRDKFFGEPNSYITIKDFYGNVIETHYVADKSIEIYLPTLDDPDEIWLRLEQDGEFYYQIADFRCGCIYGFGFTTEELESSKQSSSSGSITVTLGDELNNKVEEKEEILEELEEIEEPDDKYDEALEEQEQQFEVTEELEVFEEEPETTENETHEEFYYQYDTNREVEIDVDGVITDSSGLILGYVGSYTTSFDLIYTCNGKFYCTSSFYYTDSYYKKDDAGNILIPSGTILENHYVTTITKTQLVTTPILPLVDKNITIIDNDGNIVDSFVNTEDFSKTGLAGMNLPYDESCEWVFIYDEDENMIIYQTPKQLVDSEELDTDGTGNTNQSTSTPNTNVPATGDQISIYVYLIIFSVVGLILVNIGKFKKDK